MVDSCGEHNFPVSDEMGDHAGTLCQFLVKTSSKIISFEFLLVIGIEEFASHLAGRTCSWVHEHSHITKKNVPRVCDLRTNKRQFFE